MRAKNFLASLFPILIGDPSEYRKKHTYKVRFKRDYRYHDRDRDRQLRVFHVHGEAIMAYSKKDAIKRWVHMDLKNRRKK